MYVFVITGEDGVNVTQRGEKVTFQWETNTALIEENGVVVAAVRNWTAVSSTEMKGKK